MGYIKGVNLLPSTGEFTYDTVAYLGKRTTEPGLSSINRYASGGSGSTTDYTLALNNLQSELPDCGTVAVVVAWFGGSTDISAGCHIYPSTTYIGGSFQIASGGTDYWRCSGLTQNSSGLIAIPSSGGTFVYGGTPSDQSIVRCIQDLNARGLRVVFYPFILMTASGFPWRGRITYAPGSNGWPTDDVSSAATRAVNAFLGSASTGQFSRDYTNFTVGYYGSSTDWTYRRMILHYANLCVIAGGVDLFLIGSEFRGLESIRGPAWTKAGVTGGDGKVTWDYPFVNGLITLSDDVRSVFDGAGYTKDLTGLHNLISYSADWSAWMGLQHPGENGQWPHLDQLFGHTNIDLVSFDNYLPLSDWTTGTGGLDVLNWSAPAPNSWPPSAPNAVGLGLSGTPTLYSLAYLQANIEGGEKFNWFYNNSNNDGRGFDPNGTDLQVSRPEGDRLAQNRQPYYAGQQLLANKQLRWWWHNPHQAVYDTGSDWAPQGPYTEWAAQSKSIIFAEYGFPSCDKATNQPNVFFDAKSTESDTPFWSVWDSADGMTFRPRKDDNLYLLALQAIYEYWFVNGNNQTSGAGVVMLQEAFCSVWNWDARPFPAFPNLTGTWGDAGNWPSGNWLGGKGPFITPPVPDAPPSPPSYPAFPTINGQGWSVHYRPVFTTAIAGHVSGRESRVSRMAAPLFEIELTYDLLRMDVTADLQTLIGFYNEMQGQDSAFTFPVPAPLGQGTTLLCRFAEDSQDLEEFMNRLFLLQSLKLRTVRS